MIGQSANEQEVVRERMRNMGRGGGGSDKNLRQNSRPCEGFEMKKKKTPPMTSPMHR